MHTGQHGHCTNCIKTYYNPELCMAIAPLTIPDVAYGMRSACDRKDALSLPCHELPCAWISHRAVEMFAVRDG